MRAAHHVSTTPATVILADDHPIILSGLEALLEPTPFRVLGRCTDGARALALIKDLQPDLAIVDVARAGLNSVDVLRHAARERLRTRIVIFTASTTEAHVVAAVRHGAWGVVFKDASPELLLACLKDVASGERCLPAGVIEGAMLQQRPSAGPDPAASLTPRERESAALVAGGLSNKEISRRLRISEGTVKIHLHNIYEKLGVGNRTSLATLAQRFLEQR
jgi:DNA-binding NarL/FixJ family response regulator